jgi:ammonium transporter, Amt family
MAADSTVADGQQEVGLAQPTHRIAGLPWMIGGIVVVAGGGGVLSALTQHGTGNPNGGLAVADLLWLFLATALVLLALLGFALRATGYSRRKNALKTMQTHLATIFLGLLGFFFLGFGFQSGGLAQLTNEITVHINGVAWGIIGLRGFTLSGNAYDNSIAMLFLFQAGVMAIALMIPLGAMLERFRFSAAVVYILFASAVLYPIFANWAWGGGWLSQLGNVGLGAGYVDFAGSGVIHAVGGWAALAGVSVLRPRIRKFNMDETPNVIPPHNLVYVLTGSMLVLIGWLGIVAGSAAGVGGNGGGRIGLAVVVIIMAGVGGALAALLYSWAIARPTTKSIPTKGYPDATMAMNGGIAGLVAGSAGCVAVSPLSGLIIGAVAGLLLPISMTFFEERLLIDDPVGAISVHGICGLWGTLAVGIFADGTLITGGHAVKGLIAGDATQIVAQMIGIVAAFVWGFGGGGIFFNVLNRLLRLRVSARGEMHNQGLDVLEMGAPAYSLRNDPVHGEWPEVATGGAAYIPDN